MDKKEFLINKGYGDMLEGMSPIEIEDLFNSVTGDFTGANTYREPGNRGGRVGYQTGGISMGNTLAQNLAANRAQASGIGTMLQRGRSRLPGAMQISGPINWGEQSGGQHAPGGQRWPNDYAYC